LAGGQRNIPSSIELDLGRRWLSGPDHRGTAADCRAGGRGRTVEAASGDRPVTACHPAGGCGAVPAREARACEALAEPGSGDWWSGGGLESDRAAEGFELADVVALAAFGADAGGVVAEAKVVGSGAGVR